MDSMKGLIYELLKLTVYKKHIFWRHITCIWHISIVPPGENKEIKK